MPTPAGIALAESVYKKTANKIENFVDSLKG